MILIILNIDNKPPSVFDEDHDTTISCDLVSSGGGGGGGGGGVVIFFILFTALFDMTGTDAGLGALNFTNSTTAAARTTAMTGLTFSSSQPA